MFSRLFIKGGWKLDYIHGGKPPDLPQVVVGFIPCAPSEARTQSKERSNDQEFLATRPGIPVLTWDDQISGLGSTQGRCIQPLHGWVLVYDVLLKFQRGAAYIVFPEHSDIKAHSLFCIICTCPCNEKPVNATLYWKVGFTGNTLKSP